jgi:hypothetical protein
VRGFAAFQLNEADPDMATIPAQAQPWDVSMPGVDVESGPLPAPHAWHPSGVPAVRPRTGTPAQVLVPLGAPTSVSARQDRSATKALVARARALWPGLLPSELAGTRGDPHRIVRLAARRSNEAPEVLMRMLLGDHAGSDRR